MDYLNLGLTPKRKGDSRVTLRSVKLSNSGSWFVSSLASIHQQRYKIKKQPHITFGELRLFLTLLTPPPFLKRLRFYYMLSLPQ